MKKLISFAFLSLALAFTSIYGCGGGGSNSNQLGLDNSLSCDFQLSSFMNGPNAEHATSYWSCTEAGVAGILAVFADGAGYSSTAGAFTWSQTGCRSVSYDGGNASGEITDINGTTTSGILTAKDHVNGHVNNASCVLQLINSTHTNPAAPTNGSSNSNTNNSTVPNVAGTYDCTNNCTGVCDFGAVMSVTQSGSDVTTNSSTATCDTTLETNGYFTGTCGSDQQCQGNIIGDALSATCTVSGTTCQMVTYTKR